MDKCKECGQPKRPDSASDPTPKVAIEWRCGTSEEFLRWLRHSLNLRATGS